MDPLSSLSNMWNTRSTKKGWSKEEEEKEIITRDKMDFLIFYQLVAARWCCIKKEENQACQECFVLKWGDMRSKCFNNQVWNSHQVTRYVATSDHMWPIKN